MFSSDGAGLFFVLFMLANLAVVGILLPIITLIDVSKTPMKIWQKFLWIALIVLTGPVICFFWPLFFKVEKWKRNFIIWGAVSSFLCMLWGAHILSVMKDKMRNPEPLPQFETAFSESVTIEQRQELAAIVNNLERELRDDNTLSFFEITIDSQLVEKLRNLALDKISNEDLKSWIQLYNKRKNLSFSDMENF